VLNDVAEQVTISSSGSGAEVDAIAWLDPGQSTNRYHRVCNLSQTIVYISVLFDWPSGRKLPGCPALGFPRILPKHPWRVLFDGFELVLTRLTLGVGRIIRPFALDLDSVASGRWRHVFNPSRQSSDTAATRSDPFDPIY